MYGISGRRRLPETELTWLAGYEGSLPVRAGNAAADQLQLDVWGEVLDGLSLTRNALLTAPDDSWDLQIALMEHLEGAWDQPDNGLWEMRGPRRHCEVRDQGLSQHLRPRVARVRGRAGECGVSTSRVSVCAEATRVRRTAARAARSRTRCRTRSTPSRGERHRGTARSRRR